MATMYERISTDLAFYEKKYNDLVKAGFFVKHTLLQAEMKRLIASLKTLKRMS
jgi:hypothetical protein